MEYRIITASIVPSGYITYMPDSRDRVGGDAVDGGADVRGVNWYVAPPAKIGLTVIYGGYIG